VLLQPWPATLRCCGGPCAPTLGWRSASHCLAQVGALEVAGIITIKYLSSGVSAPWATGSVPEAGVSHAGVVCSVSVDLAVQMTLHNCALVYSRQRNKGVAVLQKVPALISSLLASCLVQALAPSPPAALSSAARTTQAMASPCATRAGTTKHQTATRWGLADWLLCCLLSCI
jgi:hypothetical protein